MKTIFEIGDRVFDIQHGWGKVKEIALAQIYSVIVDFDKVRESYTEDGCATKNSLIPTLSFTEYSLQGFSQERPLSIGDRVFVKDNEDDYYIVGYVHSFNSCKRPVIKTRVGIHTWDCVTTDVNQIPKHLKC